MWTAIIQAFTNKQRFIISSHVNPDCDALGSELALAYHLRDNLGKTVAILNSDPVIPTYRFLDPETLIQTFERGAHADLVAQSEVIIIVDASGGWERLGPVGKALSQTEALTICIDHHPDNDRFTDLSVVESEVIAAGELIFELIAAMRGRLTPLMAQALYAAILTDSGSFRFAKTSANTHRIVAQLLEAGARPDAIYKAIYMQQPLSLVQLKGHVLQSIRLAAGGQIAYVGLDAATMATYQTEINELNTFSNLPQQIAGVRIAILAVELPDGRIKISLRGDGSLPLNQLAAQFGGGGHVPAAGATTNGSLDDVLTQLVERAGQMLH